MNGSKDQPSNKLDLNRDENKSNRKHVGSTNLKDLQSKFTIIKIKKISKEEKYHINYNPPRIDEIRDENRRK